VERPRGEQDERSEKTRPGRHHRALVEENIDTFAGTDQDRYMLRVLEDLWTMREELETLERGEG
jgi:hypothetical protein